MRSQAFRLAQPTRLQGYSPAHEERLAARRGTRGLLVAIGLGLAAWLATGIAVGVALFR
jgi:hypothetical protein